jgi:hypothetical protein
MMKITIVQCVAGLLTALFLSGCLPSGKTKTRNLPDDRLIFSQAQKALDARDYPDAAELLDIFLREFPDSKHYTWGLQRMGEAMQGLLQTRYLRPIANGQEEATARAAFLASYGRYSCWVEDNSRLSYDGSHYHKLLDEDPDSDIADEAAYRLALLRSDPLAGPEKIEQEVQELGRVLERYPSTSLRYEILYTMAYRYHQLYELYAYSNKPGVADRAKAQHYREKAVYLYSLAIKSPRHSLYAEKAWQNLMDIEDGRRIFP